MSNPFIIDRVMFTPGEEILSFISTDGRTVKVDLEGDCCSRSFFDREDVTDPRECVGDTLLAVTGECVSSYSCRSSPSRSCFFARLDCESYYNLHVKTNKREFRVPFRNDSNGYYGGWANIHDEAIKDG